MIECKKILFQGLEAYQLENQFLQLIVLPQTGGRIVSLRFAEEEIFYNVHDNASYVWDLSRVQDFQIERKNWISYRPMGGCKTWLAPQTRWDWPPYLDLEFGEYQVKIFEGEGGMGSQGSIELQVVSPICRETGMQFTRAIRLTSDQKQVSVRLEMKNTHEEPREFGLWDVTQILDSGMAIFPIADQDDLIHLMDVDTSQYLEIIQCQGQLYACVHCPGQIDFKVGTPFSKGWLLTILSNDQQQIGYLKRFPVFEDAAFGHGCAVEVYDTNQNNYFEVEVHGPMTALTQGTGTGFIEEWELFRWEPGQRLTEIITEIEQKTKVAKVYGEI